MTDTQYAHAADRLCERIVALGPVILTLDDAWKLFKVPGFRCDDLQPSFMQAAYALAKAKSILASQEQPE